MYNHNSSIIITNIPVLFFLAKEHEVTLLLETCGKKGIGL